MTDVNTSTKRAYADLADYAQAHGTTAAVYRAAGWTETTRRNRPAFEFKTASGPRWRFRDDQKPTYDQNPGYQACWYGLKRAIVLSPPLVECNGAASTAPAQAKGVAAFSVQGGEGIGLHSRQYLLDELSATGYSGIIYVAFDCDETGRKAAVKRVQEYRAAGFEAEALDLALGIDGGDLADFVAHHDNPVEALTNCKRLLIPSVENRPKRTTPYVSSSADNMAIAAAALAVLNISRCEDQGDWYQIGMAVKDGCGEAGYGLFDDWSRPAKHYKESTNLARWNSFKVGGGNKITFATLVHLANDDFGGNSWNPSVKPKPLPAAPIKDTKPVNKWVNGFPDAVRAALNLYAPPGTSAVLNVWVDAINCGFLEWNEPVDAPYLKCVFDAMGVKLSIAAIRSVTDPDAVQFVKKMAHYSISIDYLDLGGNTIEWAEILTNRCGCENPVKVGRKANLFTLKSPNQIIADISQLAILPILEKAFPADSDIVAPINVEFLRDLDCAEADVQRLADELDERYGDLLRAQPGYKWAMNQARKEFRRLKASLTSTKSVTVPLTYKSTAEYVAMFYRALINAEGGETQYSRAALCAQIGLDEDKKLPKVFAAAGVTMLKKQCVDVPLADIAAVNAVRTEWSTEHKGFPSALVSSLKPKTAFSLKIAVEKRLSWATAEIATGATISLRYNQANRQTTKAQLVVDDETVINYPEPKPAEPAPAELPGMKSSADIYTKWITALAQFKALARVLVAGVQRVILWSVSEFWARCLKRFKATESKAVVCKKRYSEGWLDKLAEAALPPEVREVGLVNSDGELLEPTTTNVIGVLLNPPALPPSPDVGWLDIDDLLADMIGAGGVIVAVEEQVPKELAA